MNEKLQDEERRMRRLRFIVDLAQAVLIQQHDLTLREAFEIMQRHEEGCPEPVPGQGVRV